MAGTDGNAPDRLTVRDVRLEALGLVRAVVEVLDLGEREAGLARGGAEAEAELGSGPEEGRSDPAGGGSHRAPFTSPPCVSDASCVAASEPFDVRASGSGLKKGPIGGSYIPSGNLIGLSGTLSLPARSIVYFERDRPGLMVSRLF